MMQEINPLSKEKNTFICEIISQEKNDSALHSNIISL